MDLNLLKKQAWQSMGKRYSHPDRELGYAFYHGQRVGKIALKLRELIFQDEESYDDVILVGSWFHDVGKGIEPHWEYGSLICQTLLKELSTPAQLDQIVEIVRGHTLRKEKEYPHYVKLVQDADILDHFGTQEIWLNFWHNAYQRKNLKHSLEFYAEQYILNVEKVRPLLNYKQSIEFFDEKDRFVREFVDRLSKEGLGELVEK